MKTAHIVPDKYIGVAAQCSDYHLVLSGRLQESKVYREAYQKLAQSGDLVIVDNSAHELGVGLGGVEFFDLAFQVGAREVVLPDRLFMGDDTYELSYEMADLVYKRRASVGSFGPSFLVVPQGRVIDEWYRCLERLITIPWVTTVGISKDYATWPGGLRLLVDLTYALKPTLDVHMLGLPREIDAVYEVLAGGKPVRGIDTSKPAGAAMLGLAWDSSTSVRRRPSGFFECEKIDIELLKRNLQTFSWAMADSKRQE